MHVVSTIAALSAVALATSVTAASPDAEPTTASALQNNVNATSTDGTSERGLGRNCKAMWSQNWSDFKYACSWYHPYVFGNEYNLFFMRFDGSVVKECDCDNHLATYDPWGSHWTHSIANNNQVRCYSRDGKQASEIKSVFDSYKCN